MSGNNIRNVCIPPRRSLMVLAHETGTIASRITYVERYGNGPGHDLRKWIADALGVTEGDL